MTTIYEDILTIIEICYLIINRLNDSADKESCKDEINEITQIKDMLIENLPKWSLRK